MRIVSVLVVALGISVGLSAQQQASSKMPATKMGGDSAKVQRAVAAGPSDITKNAAVVEVDAKGAMHELRKGSNGWTCMLIATSPTSSEAMCGDKEWADWANAYMAKKAPTTKSVGIAYMLHGDNGASNIDPFAMGPTATND